MSVMHGESSADRSNPGEPRRERLLLFRIGGKYHGLMLASIAALSPPGRIRRVRPSTPGVLGITEWRGRLLTVLDLSLLLEADETSPPLSLIHLATPFERTTLYLAGPVRLEACDVARHLEPDIDGTRRLEFEGEAVRLVEPAVLMDRIRTLRNA